MICYRSAGEWAGVQEVVYCDGGPFLLIKNRICCWDEPYSMS